MPGRGETAPGKVLNTVDPPPITQRRSLAACRRRLGEELRLLHLPTWVFMLLAVTVELLGAAARRPVPLTRYRVRSLRPLENFDLAAARDVLGWQPRTGVLRGMAATFGNGAADAAVPDDGAEGLRGIDA